MKRFLIASAIIITIVGFSLAIFYPNISSIANKDFPYEGDEPDIPANLKDKGGLSKEEFMLLRAESAALLRGIDKEKPTIVMIIALAIKNLFIYTSPVKIGLGYNF